MPTPKSKSTADSKIFDVAKPGESAPSSNARPIIVGHNQAMQQDPMVVADETDTPEQEPFKPIKKSELKLAPINVEAPVEEASDPESSIEPETTPPQDSEEPDSDSGLAPPAEPEQDTAEEPASDEANAAVDVLADEALKQRESKEDELALQRNKEIEKAIASRKYYVKTRMPAAKRNVFWLLFFIVIIAASAGWYLLLGPGKDILM